MQYFAPCLGAHWPSITMKALLLVTVDLDWGALDGVL